uniref:Uncharacterized protein n=1 Tax=Anopheles atroparvus TaxID=41427 RepID=A0A182JKN3_ANOAO
MGLVSLVWTATGAAGGPGEADVDYFSESFATKTRTKSVANAHHIMLSEVGGTWEAAAAAAAAWLSWCCDVGTPRWDRCSDGSSFGLVSHSRLDIDCAPCTLWACEWATSDCAPPVPVSAFFFCLRSLARRFWNQIFTWRSESCRFCASSDFRRIVM